MAMTDYWYPLEFSAELEKNQALSRQLLGMRIAIYRDTAGIVHAIDDACAHRSGRLSDGKVCGTALQCPYHGWQFNGEGQCVKIPTLKTDERIPVAAKVRCFPVQERGGLVWVWAGEASVATESPEMFDYEKQWADDPQWRPVDFSRDLNFDHSLLIENLMDPAHVHFVHEGSISSPSRARSYDIDIIHDQWGFVSSREDTPVSSRFQFPCATTLFFEFGPGTRMIHVAYCVPVDDRHTRLLYRIYSRSAIMAGMGKGAMIRGSSRILDEDIALLEVLQQQIDEGRPPYRVPVREDRAIIAYRQWLDKARQTPALQTLTLVSHQ
jgi:phenylpropionate dioxygenase-like ring-hydroxylating dioxygenase large terminal subunit